jgi:hypothetical protein
MKNNKNGVRTLSIGVATTLVAFVVAVGVISGAPNASAVEWSSVQARLGAANPVAVKVAAEETVVIQTSPLPKQKTEIVVQTATTSGSTAKKTSSKSTSSSTSSSSSGTSDLAKAQSILAGLIAKYPILKGSVVTIGSTPNNYQAVCYYKSGKIVINPNHTASLSTILRHEVGHIIDWRDNGVIDWGESIPAL